MDYGTKCYYGNKLKFKNFQIFGLDVILDEDCKPYLLEVNGNPSLNIEYDDQDYGQKGRSQLPVCEVDKFVKAR